MSITNVTRRESNEALDRATICKHIKRILVGRTMTAREIAEEMYRSHLIPYPVRQATAPRLTELEAEGVVEAVGKVYDNHTKRYVAAYRLVSHG